MKYKRGLLQNLFPQTGQNTPRLRFPGYEDKWECLSLSQLFDYERPEKYIVSSEKYVANGNTPVLTANKSFILGYTDDTEGICRKGEVILFDDFTCNIKYVNFPFKVKSSAVKLLTASGNMPLYFGYSLLKHINYKPMGHSRHWISVLQPYVTRVPTLSEQRKIAGFLCLVQAEFEKAQQFLDELTVLRKALMQQMFI